MSQVDSSSDGNAGVVSLGQPLPPFSSQVPSSPPSSVAPPPSIAGQGRLLEEKSDRISKEKQKFFRSSAFNAEHSKKRLREKSKELCCKVAKKPDKPDKQNKPDKSDKPPAKRKVNRRLPVLSSSSSSSDSSSEDSSASSSSNGSSSEDLPVSVSCKKSPKKDLTESESPWGFAAAAAKLKVDAPLFSSINNTFGATLPKLDLGEKPTFGLHIQPAASPGAKTKKKSSSSGSSGINLEKVKGVGQLKGLYDGLSHFFLAPGNSRVRSGDKAPNYAPDRRKKNEEEKDKKEKEKNKIVKKKELKDCEEDKKMTPSNLVKTAVNSKRHEQSRRRTMNAVKCADFKKNCADDKNSGSGFIVEGAKQLQADQPKSNPGHSKSSQPRACTSANTTNTTTTPRATPCSNRKGKSLPPPAHEKNILS